MRRRFLSALFVVVSALPAYGNLITNGDFELPGCIGSPTLICPGTTPSGWTLQSGNVDIVTSGAWQQAPGGGIQNIDLNGRMTGAILQSFATTVGTSYTLTYYLAGNSDGGPALKTLDVLVGPSALSLTTISSPSFDTSDPLLNHSNMGYLLQSVQFVASSTLTYLEFRSTTFDSAFGPVLDNVDVSELPEPASFLLIAGGLVLLGLKKLR